MVSQLKYAIVEENGRQWLWRYDWYVRARDREEAFCAKYPESTSVMKNVRFIGTYYPPSL